MDILIYLLKTNLCLVIFYGFYWVFLRRNTFFVANRIYLLSSIVLSFCMPFVKVKHNYDFESPLPLTLNEISVESFKSFLYQPIVGNINWVDIMAIIYLSGAMFILARVVFAFFKIYNLLINGDPIGEEEKATYAEFLFAYNFRTNASTLSNNFFNDSLLKERIMMIMKVRSSMWVAAKYALIVPMLAIIGYFIVVKDIRRGDDAWKPQRAVKR